ncbi:hypothetical protein BC831DRAFT_254863 [Entophlyctis helioformis]|nr:hypothetical protein BC831DRAFT_254863 [Entophlyctis helioformis]
MPRPMRSSCYFLLQSIPPTNDIPGVVSILPSDDILTDDKPNAAVPDTTAIPRNDHLTSTAESPATSTDLAPAPQDAAVSAAQDPITHSQSVVERVKSAEPAVVARAREFGERTGDQLAITQVIAYSPTRLEFDVRWLVKIGTSDRNQVHVSFFEPSVAKRLLRQTVKTEMSDETIESIVKTPYDPSVKKNIRRGGKNKKR